MIKERRQMFGTSGTTHFTKAYDHMYHSVVSTICARHMRGKSLTEEQRNEVIDYTVAAYNHVERELIELGILKQPIVIDADFEIRELSEY